MKTIRSRTLAAAFLGGAASLVYELIWMRWLALLLGSTAYAAGTVTACYMAGLAVGGFVLGRLADTNEQRCIRLSFGGFGVLCAVSPLIYRAIQGIYWFLGQGMGGGLWLRVMIAMAGLFLPAFFIGGMTPVLVGRGLREADSTMVYAVFTLGSAVGALLTGFLLIPALGLRGCGIAGGLCACAGMFCLHGRRIDTVTEHRTSHAERAFPASVRLCVAAVYTVSGFTAMAYQMYQTKVLTLFFMDSAYDFTVILTVFLIGLFGGNCLGNWLARRENQRLAALCAVQAALGLCCIVSLLPVSRLPYWTEGISTVSTLAKELAQNAFLHGILLKYAYCMLVVLPSAVLWGSVFPLASRIFLSGQGNAAAQTGLLTGWNTAGSALGSLLGSFALTGWIGLRGGILLGAALNLACAVCLLFTGKKRLPVWHRAGICGIGLAAVLVFALLPAWDRFEMSSSFLKPGQDVEGAAEMLYYQEDASGITSVIYFRPNGRKYLTTNRLYCQSTADLGGPEDHRRLGYLPLLLHPDPQEVLITGLGSGVTLRGAAEYGTARIDCVEISRSVVEAANCFQEENGGVLDRENVQIIVEDARNYMQRTAKRYDVMIGDIVFPMSSGSSSLFSREYYASARARLKQGGMMVQWLPIHQFSQEDLELTANTFASVFPHSYYVLGLIGRSVPTVGLVGMETPLSVELDRLQACYDSKTDLRGQLEQTALDDPYMLLSHYIGEIHADVSQVLTDDRPILEYRNPRTAASYAERGRGNLAWLLAQKRPARTITACSAEEERVLDAYDQMLIDYIQSYILS